ncbi:MAG: hypothetical protein EU549_02190 [Promethearchaeota archaeon]|nr:MAG: hypothetical protein EU549_02190 [Candidatus Lokiarchaeota archaeon]
MNGQEFVTENHRKLLDEIQWISDIGVDNLVVTIPYLIELIKEQFPKFTIRVSTIARVNSVNKAKFFEMLGADEITPDVMINRNFKILEKMVKALNCKINLLTTDGCLYECPFRQYHYNLCGHGSQTLSDRYYIDYPLISCSIIKFSNPAEIMKCRWVRPEDLKYYEDLGISNFKIGGRRLPTDRIMRSVKAYSDGKYDGNLADIVQGYSFSFGSIQQLEPNKGFGKTVEEEKKANLYIDNTKLDGFIDFFKNQQCRAMCDECNYCAEWAKKAIIIDEEGTQIYLDSLKTFRDNLVTSREFGIERKESKKEKKRKKKKTKLEWNPETHEIFETMVSFSPQEFQSMTRMVIGSMSEKKAKNRGSEIVENQDMIQAFLEGTPGPYQEEMKENLKKMGLIKA